MKILVACEESQAVTKEFRKAGHEAYSCGIVECSGGHPEWHIKGDVIPLINGHCSFETADGAGHNVKPNIIVYKNGKGTDSPWNVNTMGLPKEERAKLRSKTFPGIEKAMAEQWG